MWWVLNYFSGFFIDSFLVIVYEFRFIMVIDVKNFEGFEKGVKVKIWGF